MLTTGILSLNIHDSLTFDGCELCLNPDLFAAVAEHGGTPVPGKARATHQYQQQQQQQHHGGSANASINSGNSSSTALTVGDTIEIRVWDPLPKEAAGTVKSPSSFLRKGSVRQSPQQNRQQIQVPVPAPAAEGENAASSQQQQQQQNPRNTIPSLRPRTSSYSEPDQTADALDAQTVITSSSKGSSKGSNPQADNPLKRDSESKIGVVIEEDDNPPLPPSKTVVTPSQPPPQQSLPPVFPRSRTGTVDNVQPMTPAGNKLPKPIMIHRRAASSASAIPIRSPKQSQNQFHPLSARHVREISDMTVDTHQLDIFGATIHPTDSNDLAWDDTNENDASLSKIASTHRLRLSFVLKVTEKTLSSMKGNSRTQISMLRQVADLYNLSTYDLVTVHKIDPQDEDEVLKAVSADFVVVTIKDQFISRGDMLLFQTKLVGSWIYEGQRLTETTRGIKAHAREIRHGNYSAKSGIVTDKTMITFRSRSARIIWLVQLSSEMWDYSSPYEHQYEPESICEIYFDQWIRFLYKLFKKWKELEVCVESTSYIYIYIYIYILIQTVLILTHYVSFR
jgi:hypothetical protein